MSDHQKHREAMTRKCLEAMSAKGLTFKSLAATIQLSPFITAAALWGQMPLPQDVGLSPKPAKLDFARDSKIAIGGPSMLAAIVVLHLVVHDANTGMLLYEAERAMPSYANTIDACRKTGVAKAKRLASEYRNTYPAASANVDCEWRRGVAPGDPA